MKTLHTYISSRYLLIFWITLVVFTFVLSIGVVFRVSSLLAKDVNGIVILQMFQYEIPQALTLAIPISILCSVLLLFGQLSSDGEVSAMKACGISLWQIIRMPIIFGVLGSLACFYIQNTLAPQFHFERKTLERTLKSADILKTLEEGQWWYISDDTRVHCERVIENILYDVDIVQIAVDRVKQASHADRLVSTRVVTNGAAVAPNLIAISNKERAEFAVSMELEEFVRLDGYDVSIDPLQVGVPGVGNFETYRWWVPSSRLGGRKYTRKTVDMGSVEIWGLIKKPEATLVAKGPEAVRYKTSERLVEIHKRLALSIACLAFVFLGLPFGIRSHRKESSVGIGISLLLVLFFYVFIILADVVHESMPYAWALCWVPVAIAMGLGSLMIKRLN